MAWGSGRLAASAAVGASFAVAGALLAATAGCWLPISTASPQSATTVGQKNVGITFYGEFPTLDLIATTTEGEVDPDEYAVSPFPTASFQLAVGVTDHFDLEVALDGTLLIVLPVIYGGSIGSRYQLLFSESVAVAAFARVGYIGLGVSEEIEGSTEESQVSAFYGTFGGAVEARSLGPFRPRLALSAWPARVENTITNDTEESFFAFAGSATVTAGFAFGPVELGPFANVAYFRSPNLRGSKGFVTGGLMVSLRPQKKPAPAEPPPAPTTPPPSAW